MEKAKPKGEKQMETGVVSNDLTTLQIHLTSSWSSTTLPDCDCCGLVVFFVCFFEELPNTVSQFGFKSNITERSYNPDVWGRWRLWEVEASGEADWLLVSRGSVPVMLFSVLLLISHLFLSMIYFSSICFWMREKHQPMLLKYVC